jgi:diguanylate cyclase (GGDEF)-like protein
MARLGRNYVIAMTDVDHFKKFNDTYGHDVGDQVLRMVASQLRKVSGGGTAYRYGGEEFTVLYPGKSISECLPHLEALRRNIEEYRMRLRDKQSRPEDAKRGRNQRGQSKSQHVSVAISIGVAERSDEHRDPQEVIKAADQALYKAKEAGRNRVVAYGQKAVPATRRKAVATR